MRQRRITDRQFAIPHTLSSAAVEPRVGPQCPVGEQLFAIHEPGFNIVHLERPIDGRLVAALDNATVERAFRVEHFFDASASGASALDAFVHEQLGACDEHARRFASHDVLRWARAFASLTGQKHIKVTLASVWSDSCRKFHADFVGLRMLCTYVGQGTDYVSDEFVDREGADDVDPEDIQASNVAMLRDPGAVRRCATGDLIVLKGESYPGNRGFGAIHRSPPIQQSRGRRLVLTLDELNPMLGEHAH
jgi:hypothetical protein